MSTYFPRGRLRASGTWWMPMGRRWDVYLRGVARILSAKITPLHAVLDTGDHVVVIQRGQGETHRAEGQRQGLSPPTRIYSRRIAEENFRSVWYANPR